MRNKGKFLLILVGLLFFTGQASAATLVATSPVQSALNKAALAFVSSVLSTPAYKYLVMIVVLISFSYLVLTSMQTGSLMQPFIYLVVSLILYWGSMGAKSKVTNKPYATGYFESIGQPNAGVEEAEAPFLLSTFLSIANYIGEGLGNALDNSLSQFTNVLVKDYPLSIVQSFVEALEAVQISDPTSKQLLVGILKECASWVAFQTADNLYRNGTIDSSTAWDAMNWANNLKQAAKATAVVRVGNTLYSINCENAFRTITSKVNEDTGAYAVIKLYKPDGTVYDEWKGKLKLAAYLREAVDSLKSEMDRRYASLQDTTNLLNNSTSGWWASFVSKIVEALMGFTRVVAVAVVRYYPYLATVISVIVFAFYPVVLLFSLIPGKQLALLNYLKMLIWSSLFVPFTIFSTHLFNILAQLGGLNKEIAKVMNLDINALDAITPTANVIFIIGAAFLITLPMISYQIIMNADLSGVLQTASAKISSIGQKGVGAAVSTGMQLAGTGIGALAGLAAGNPLLGAQIGAQVGSIAGSGASSMLGGGGGGGASLGSALGSIATTAALTRGGGTGGSGGSSGGSSGGGNSGGAAA